MLLDVFIGWKYMYSDVDKGIVSNCIKISSVTAGVALGQMEGGSSWAAGRQCLGVRYRLKSVIKSTKFNVDIVRTYHEIYGVPNASESLLLPHFTRTAFGGFAAVRMAKIGVGQQDASVWVFVIG